MLQSALIALDGSAASEVATQMAIRFANTRKGESRHGGAGPLLLTGIAVLDRPTITKPQATPVGGGAYKKERDETLLAEADQKIEAILRHFESVCEAAGMKYATVRAEGLPHEVIAAASHVHDVIVIGQDTNFHFQTGTDRCETFKQTLQNHPCPMIVTPNELPQGNGILVAYDGSLAASRALHMFVLMEPNVDGLDFHVVSIHKSEQQAENNCSEAVELLRRHAIDARPHPVASGANPTRILIDTAERLSTRMVVMGAFGHQGLRTVFFGSTTREMLDQCLFPLFIY
jgi:nucleotide-binding universal stress UspA family protein